MDIILLMDVTENEGCITGRVKTQGEISNIIQGAGLAISELVRIIVKDSNGGLTAGDVINRINSAVIKDVYDDIR